MRVLLLSRYDQSGPSSRLRFYQHLPVLARHGLEFVVSPLFGPEYIASLYRTGRRSPAHLVRAYLQRRHTLKAIDQFDLLWVEYEVWPWLPAFVEKRYLSRGVPFVLELDDGVYHRYDMHRSAFVRRALGSKIDKLMRWAKLVIAGNEYLAGRAKRAGARRVETIPTAIDVERYRPTYSRGDGPFTVGWIGSPANLKYLSLVRGALAEFLRPGYARFVVVGPAEFSMDGVPCEVVPWCEADEVDRIRSFDVGIMPLEDGPWERGKCGYKLLQYMACGKPVIASPVGVNRQIVRDGRSGLLASTSAEWLRALQRLYDSAELREEMGREGRVWAEAKYSTNVVVGRLLDSLQSVTGAQQTVNRRGREEPDGRGNE